MNHIRLQVPAAALLLGAALMSLLPGSVHAQCSTGAWSNTVGSAQALGAATVPTGKKYENQCGLTVDAAGAPGYVTTTAPSNEAVFSARFYLLPAGLTISSGEVVVFQARDGGTRQIELSLRRTGSVLNLVPKVRSSGSLVEQAGIPLLGVWQGVTVLWTAGNGNGSLQVKVDGATKLSLGNLVNGAEVINETQLGIINDPAATGKLVIDAFEARRSPTGPALLAVNELANISTRADVGNGDFSVIAGFIITGDTKKCVVVRSRGQSVDVPVTRLEDPLLTVRSGNTILDENDNWQDHPTAALLVELGKQPADALDAALHICLDPGAYTAQLRGTVGTIRGVGIVEVIDVDQGTPYLYNISTRALVKNGVRRAVAGFIIDGQVARTVLIRGRGPTVNVVGRTLLADPLIELKSGANTVALNDDWGAAANAAEILATGQAPTDPVEAAILTTLQPGAYTVFLGPADGAEGIGIIEVIDQSGGSIQVQ